MRRSDSSVCITRSVTSKAFRYSTSVPQFCPRCIASRRPSSSRAGRSILCRSPSSRIVARRSEPARWTCRSVFGSFSMSSRGIVFIAGPWGMTKDTTRSTIRRAMSQPATGFATCMLCEAMCGLAVTIRDGKATRIEGDRDDPFSRGHVCPKAVALEGIRLDPDRVLEPSVRDGESWRPVDWTHAVDAAAGSLASVVKAHGRDAVAVYMGNPTAHNGHALLGAGVLLGVLRTKMRFSATSADQLPHMLVALEMFGHQGLIPVPDVDRAPYFLCIGANPLVSNGSIMTAAGIERRLKDLRARGGRLVVIDPRRTETARVADEHHFIRPGSDALLLMAMVRT